MKSSTRIRLSTSPGTRSTEGNPERGFVASRPILALTPEISTARQLVLAWGVHPVHTADVAGFTPDVFATDRALELVGEGMPFRDAYHYIKENLHELENIDPAEAIKLKTHLGAPLGLDWAYFKGRTDAVKKTVRDERKGFNKAVSKLLGVKYPFAE